MQTLESFLEATNANIFLKEFSFAQNTFSPQPNRQLELADHIIWLDDRIIVYQLKERIPDGPDTDEAAIRWFQNKILKKAKSQIRDTLDYLKQHPNISIKNQRGLSFTIPQDKITHITKVILYALPHDPPKEIQRTKRIDSSSSGFIHTINILDYTDICNSLITPAEIWEYLEFRETSIRKWPERAALVSEKALVGQFLSGELDFWPEAHYQSFLDSHINDIKNFNLTPFLDGFHKRLMPVPGAPTPKSQYEYYEILKEFSKLNRADLRAIKERFEWCLTACRSGEMHNPTRVSISRTSCGFVFVPVPTEFRENPLPGLLNIAYAAKYEDKMNREVGTAISYNSPYFDMAHCLLDFPWEPDPELEKMMRDNPILRKGRSEIAKRYKFD